MPKKDLRTENDNLKTFRDKKSTLTEQLLRRSLDELIQLKAVINQKTVCHMMDKLSNSEEKEFKAIISPSAISKNEIYKNMMLLAKEKVKLIENKKQNYKLDGDKQLEIFQLKTLIAKKEVKIKELESIIDRADIQTDNVSSLNTQTDKFDFKFICKDLYSFILSGNAAYPDEQGNLINEDTGNILLSSTIIKELLC